MVNYNNYAKTFSNSRKNLKWEEIDYFLNFIKWKQNLNILDIWCWNWRLVWELINKKINFSNYIWIDLSKWLLNEAKTQYPNFEFLELNMLNLDKIDNKFDIIFFIASFHHLNNIEDRLKVLENTYRLLNKWWMIFMTNWALNSKFNIKKYQDSVITWSNNEFWSTDYNIKIWEFIRYYHCFNLNELNFLFNKIWFSIMMNKLFTNFKNFISILKKK